MLKYFVKDEDVNKNIRIINSFEEYIKYKNLENKSGRIKKEDQINKCKIEINDIFNII